ncbi:MAG: uroporphyrinogen decarboxylase family protein [Armatimonadota bacterium]
MTGRERILAVLSGEIPDRVPVCPFVQEEFLSYIYPCKDQIDRVYDGVTCAVEFGFDLMARPKIFERPGFLRKSYPNWNVSVTGHKVDEQYIRVTTVETPRKTLQGVEAGPYCGAATSGIHMAITEYLLKDKADVEAFIEYMPRIDGTAVDDMRYLVAQWKESIGDIGIVVPWGWGSVYNHAAEYRNVESLMTDAYLEPRTYQALMEKLAYAQSEFNAELVRAGVECVGLQGNIANGAMVGYDFFKEHIQPYEQRVVDSIRSEGGKALLHNCGCATALYDNYIEMGLSAWETVAAKPQGDNDLQIAKDSIGRHMCIIGNLDQVHFLKTATEQEIAVETEKIVSIGKPKGNYIFAASDFLEKDTPVGNVQSMIESARTAGRYQ